MRADLDARVTFVVANGATPTVGWQAPSNTDTPRRNLGERAHQHVRKSDGTQVAVGHEREGEACHDPVTSPSRI